MGFDLTPKPLPVYTRVWFWCCRLSPEREHLRSSARSKFLESLGKVPRALSWPRNTVNNLAVPRFSALPTFRALLDVSSYFSRAGQHSGKNADSGISQNPLTTYL